MTQEKALSEFQAIFPEDANYLTVERERKIGYEHGDMNAFYLWNHNLPGSSSIVASSNRSFEHALAIARSGNEDIWEEDTTPIPEEREMEAAQ